MFEILCFAAGTCLGYAYGRGMFTFAGVAAHLREQVARWRNKAQ